MPNESMNRQRTSAVVISSREQPAQVIEALNSLCVEPSPVELVDVVVNGNVALAESLAVLMLRRGKSSCRVRLWRLAFGDKAHALNEYIHRIWPGRGPVLFVDGYVRVRPDSALLLQRAIHESAGALAAAAVPSAGPGAAKLAAAMRTEGGLHGNLFLLSEQATQGLRTCEFKLPLGLYRTDSTLGAALSFNLDPSKNSWDSKRRIVLVEGATWDIDQAPMWHLTEMRGRWKRLRRQAQGVLENCAVRDLFAVHRQPIRALPANAQALVAGWRQSDPESFETTLRKFHVRKAWRDLNLPRDWSLAQVEPVCLLDLQ